jgi:hypothetical protein
MSGSYLFKNPVTPFSNVDLKFASNGTHNPGNFGSNSTSLEFGLSNNFRGNVAAANASMSGGRRRTIKNIKRKYMGGKRRTRRVKSKRGLKKSRTNKRTSRRRGQRGGNNSYHQYGSQTPVNASYGINTKLSPYDSALANPTQMKSIGGDVIDNYNYNTNKGFQFW